MKAENINVIYLDNAALTPPRPEASSAVDVPDFRGRVNPHAGNKFSEQLLRAIKSGERRLLKQLGTSEFEAEVIWTSGGTEANNLAVLGAANTMSEPLTLIEGTAHKALLEPARARAQTSGRCLEVNADEQGSLLWTKISPADAKHVFLTGVCHINNETGAMQDLTQLRSWLNQNAPDSLLMVDGLQSFTKISIPWSQAGIDMLSIGGRKIGGPGHVGALIIRRGTPLQPLMHGGGQQNGLRPGTMDTAGILDFLDTAEIMNDQKTEHWQHVLRLNRFLRQAFTEEWPKPRPLIISPVEGSPYILSLAFPGFEGAILVRALARQNIIIGSGSACSSESENPSHVLRSMGIDRKTARGLIRISFSHQNTLEELKVMLRTLKQTLKEY